MKSANAFSYESTDWKLLRQQKIIESRCTCEACRTHCQSLHVHHMKSVRAYPHLAMTSGNLVVLCQTCHEILHAVLRNRMLSGLFNIYKDPTWTPADYQPFFGNVPKQFDLILREPANDPVLEYDRVLEEA